MKFSLEQQKRLFTSSSCWARYHPVGLVIITHSLIHSFTHSLDHSTPLKFRGWILWFRYTCIGVFCQESFFKFKVQFIGIFHIRTSMMELFCKNSNFQSLTINWVLNTPLRFNIFSHHSSTYVPILRSCSNFRVRMHFVSHCYNI